MAMSQGPFVRVVVKQGKSRQPNPAIIYFIYVHSRYLLPTRQSTCPWKISFEERVQSFKKPLKNTQLVHKGDGDATSQKLDLDPVLVSQHDSPPNMDGDMKFSAALVTDSGMEVASAEVALWERQEQRDRQGLLIQTWRIMSVLGTWLCRLGSRGLRLGMWSDWFYKSKYMGSLCNLLT